jgi:hypothetical protein
VDKGDQRQPADNGVIRNPVRSQTEFGNEGRGKGFARDDAGGSVLI